jgi:hypothetical protein
VGQILAEVQRILDRYEAELSKPLFEFGRKPAKCRAFLADLNASRQRLERVAGLMGSTFDARHLTTYAESQGALQNLRDYVGEVLAQGQGSVGNTRRVLGLLATAREALARLTALFDVALPTTEKHPSPVPYMPQDELVKRLSGYDNKTLLALADSLDISREYLKEVTPTTLARSLAEQAKKQDSTYQALLKEVSRQHPRPS